ncbi:unnamed protein product [Calypogeia fissa]
MVPFVVSNSSSVTEVQAYSQAGGGRIGRRKTTFRQAALELTLDSSRRG